MKIVSIKTLHLKDVLEPCKEMMEDFDEIISLHVRRTDYVEKAVDHPPCSMEYYEKALSKFDAKIPVLVFSDEPEWCMNEKLFMQVIDLWFLNQVIIN